VQRHQRDRAAGHRVGYRSHLAGGERFLLPAGVEGRHGAGEGEDGVNLIARAKELGYTVAYNREELLALDPATTDRVLGVFAHNHTFNDQE
jgi:alkaline phosphatase